MFEMINNLMFRHLNKLKDKTIKEMNEDFRVAVNACVLRQFPVLVEMRQKANREIADLKKRLKHMTDNHRDMIYRNSMLRERPDLPVDRIPATRAFEHRIKELEKELENEEFMRGIAQTGMSACKCDEWKVATYGWRALYDELWKSDDRPLGSHALPMKEWTGDMK